MVDITTAFKTPKSVYVGNINSELKSVEGFSSVFVPTSSMSSEHIYIVMIDREVLPIKLFELEKIPLTDETGGLVQTTEITQDNLVIISNKILETFRKITKYH